MYRTPPRRPIVAPALALALALALLIPSAAARAQDLEPAMWSSLRYRHIGPIGNRLSAVVGIPGDPDTYLVGAASGGVWKTSDGGVTWRPTFDDQPVQSIGALAVAPSDPNVVWAGTGEPFIRSNVVVGNGVYRSTDGGESWQHVGLEASGRVGRILVHPDDPDTAWVAALGHLYGPQQERGVYKTTDGGATWNRVLFVDENTGAVDLAFDPGNPRTIYAATWQMQIWTWGRESGGPGSGIWRSHDSGETWARLEGNGLPRGPLGKIGLATSADDPARVYALIETSSFGEFAPVEDIGVLWRSEDRGDSWRLISRDHTLTQRPLYYTRAVAAPDDADEIHFMSVLHSRSLDGGASIDVIQGGDNHDMWIDPLMPDRMIVGNDGGVAISTNRGDTWYRPYLPIAQMYHVTTDDRVPYFVYGNRQDGPSFRGPSNTLTGGDIPIGAWHSVGGCESGWAIPDPAGNVVWSGCYEGILDRYDVRTGHAQNVSVWPDNPEGWPAGELRYRFQWTFPVAMSPHDPDTVYVGSQHVHRTTDGGRSYEVISPDLTTDDPELQLKTGGLTPDDASPTYAAVLFAIAESPIERGVLWAGSNDGLLHVSRDAGETWTEVTPAHPSMPPLGTVSAVEPSRYDAGTAYVAIDLHQVNSTAPQLFRTSDYGASWTRIVDGIPEGPLSYTHVIREDPRRRGLLYAGTGNALYASFNDGARWLPLQTNLPHAPVHWLTVQERFNDLVVATYGRGFWILDDLTPLQQLDARVLSDDLHLFEPRDAWRFLRREAPVTERNSESAGDNPEYGASLNYLVSNAAAGGTARIEILSGDEVVRTLRGPAGPGIQRVWWDLRYEASSAPKLRTQPLEHPHAEFNDAGWRPLVEGGRVRPMAPPGEYLVRLTVGDTTQERSLTVLQDPSSDGTPEQIAAQTERVLAIRSEVDRVVAMIDEIEWVRSQIDDVGAQLRQQRHPAAEALLPRLTEVDGALLAIEGRLFDQRLSGGTAFQDSLRWPRRLYAKFVSLAGYMSGTDFAPTAQQIEVHERYRVELADVEAALETMRPQITALNEELAAAGIAPVQGGRERRRAAFRLRK